MYIAFKWLLSLTLAMWLAMCTLDIFIKRNSEITESRDGFYITPLILNNIKNATNPINSKVNFNMRRYAQQVRSKQTSMAYLHFVMFTAGALVVAVYRRINKIIFIIKENLYRLFTSTKAKSFLQNAKVIAANAYKFAIILYNYIREKLYIVVGHTKKSFQVLRLRSVQRPRVNLLLLNKLKHLGEERRHFGRLLIGAIRENKNIRMQCQLETMAKNRLMQHIENTHKTMKENRTKYISFQQLYLVTHQENIFLKSRVMKLTKEKNEASKSLLDLMNEVYKSKNNELIEFCNRFIVKTKENILNSDVSAEIETFLNRRSGPDPSPDRKWESNDLSDIASNSWLRFSNCTQIADIDYNCLIPLPTELPKLKGLPGEYVWTIKDKHGLIEKLYEYDCETDFDNGETIRRIREYSVYFDKDCLLDYTNSSTDIKRTYGQFEMRTSTTNLGCRPTNQRFLTGSKAFQKFMQNNKNVVSTSIIPISQSLS